MLEIFFPIFTNVSICYQVFYVSLNFFEFDLLYGPITMPTTLTWPETEKMTKKGKERERKDREKEGKEVSEKGERNSSKKSYQDDKQDNKEQETK